MAKKLFSIFTAAAISLCTVCTTYSTGMKVTAKEREEVLSQRSEYTKVFDNGNGTFTAYSNTAPIHYKNNEEWDEIDNTLVEDSDGYYKNKSNSFEILLPSEYTIGDKDNYLTIIKTDGFELPTYIKDLNIPEVATEYEKSQININNDEKGLIEELNMPYSMEEALNKATSSAKYQSISNDLDLYISVHNASISESLIANTLEAIPESITYSYPKNDICIERSEDNRILFIKDDEVRYVLSPPTIIDSSDEVNVIEVDYDLVETDEDYELTLYPLSSISSLEGLITPLSIGSEYSYDRPYTTVYNSQSAPNTVYSTSITKIGNENNDAFNTLVSVLDDLSLYSKYASIIDATFYMYVTNINNIGNHYIIAKSNNETLSGSSWNNTVGIHQTPISDTLASTGWNSINISSLMQAWLNDYNSNSNVGLDNNGFTLLLTSENNNTATVTANSGRSNTTPPILTVTFSININTYQLDYAPLKYNNITEYPYYSIYNFQYNMNCYAYALQIYNKNSGYQARPGEFGISYNPNVSMYSQLFSSYKSSTFNNDITRQQFIEARMNEDAQAMNFQIGNYFKASLINGEPTFVLPSEFNESNGRIIAMTTKGVETSYNLYSIECHFYLRNGNGSCPIHSGNCSMWSHKRGTEKVTNKSISGNEVLCDNNIAIHIGEGGYSSDARYYIINKNTNVYNSWHSSHPTTGPTPYLQ